MMFTYIKENLDKLYFQIQLILVNALLYSTIMIKCFDTFNLPIFIVLVVISYIIEYRICLIMINKWADKMTDRIMSDQYEDILEVIAESDDVEFLNEVKEILAEKNI